MSTLAIENLHVSIGETPVLRGVSLSLQQGEVHGLVGESGAGKSMIGRAVLDLLPAGARVTQGTVRYAGNELLRLPARARRALLGREIAVIPQDPMSALNPVRRIGAQMNDLMRLRLDMDRLSARRRTLALLADVLIREPERVARSYPHQLSGGMRQRVLIAMAFAGRPHLIISDEATTALDVTVQREILRLLHVLQHRDGAAVLFITHDLGLVAKLCTTASVLHGGRVLEQGAVARMLSAPDHPYTRALLAATPRLDRPADALRPIPPAMIAALRAETAVQDRRVSAAP